MDLFMSCAVSCSSSKVYQLFCVLATAIIMTTTVSSFTWVRKPENTSVTEQTTAILYCNVAGRAANEQVYWIRKTVLFNDNQAVAIVPRYSIQGEYNLVIQNVEKADAGDYTCQVGADAVVVRLTVWVAPGSPTITFSKIGTLQEGDSVSIVCTSTGGNPEPTVRMFRNNVQLSGASAIDASSGSSTLTVSRVLTYDDNQASYMCSVFNLVNEGNPKTTTTTKSVQYAPRLSLRPYNPLVILRGGSGTAECVVDANPAVAGVQWKKDTVIEPNSYNLTFDKIVEAQKGIYVCSAVNSVASSTISLTVDVQYAPDVTVLPVRSTYREGDQISVTCNFLANPPPPPEHIVWYKLGTTDVWQGQTLKFPQAVRQQNGSYSCNVTNFLQPSALPSHAGQGAAVAEIVVQYAPGASSISGAVDVVKGERAQFTCSSADPGIPPANYKWRKLSAPAVILSTEPSLVIVQTQLSDDGTYQCVPYNDVAEGPAANVTLIILERPEWQTKLPGVTTAKITDAGFSLTCVVRGKPEPSVTWEKDGVPLADTDGYYSTTTTLTPVSPNSFVVTSALFFKGAKRTLESTREDGLRVSDAGNYTCLAKNTYGRITSAGQLVINYQPVIDRSVTRVAVDPNATATLNCRAQALPAPSFLWYFGAQALKHDGKTYLIADAADPGRVDAPYGSQLMVEGVRAANYGVYRCEATNSVGMSALNISVTVKTVPDAPANLSADSITWETASIRWTPGFDGGFPQTFYIIRDQAAIPVPGTLSAYTLAGLKPNTTYSISSYAKNQLGVSTQSGTISVTTNVLSLPPLKEVSYHVTRHTVTFSAPTDVAYCIRVDVSNDDGQSWSNYAPCDSAGDGTLKLDANNINQVNLWLCLQQRPDVCAPPVRAAKVDQVEAIPTSTIIIVGCVCGAVILVLLIVFIVLCIRRRRPEKEYPERPNMRPNSLPTNARASDRKHRGIDNPGMENMERPDNGVPVFTTNSSNQYSNGHANGNVPYEMNDLIFTRDNSIRFGHPGDFNSIEKKNLKNLPNVHIPYSDQNGLLKLDDSSNSHPESGYSTPDPTKPKKVIYEVVV